MIGRSRTQLRIEDCRVAVEVKLRRRPGALLNPTRMRRVAHPRQLVMAIAYEIAGVSNRQVAKYFGRSDHTTVVHARYAVSDRATASPAYAQDLDDLRLCLRVYACQIEQAGWSAAPMPSAMEAG